MNSDRPTLNRVPVFGGACIGFAAVALIFSQTTHPRLSLSLDGIESSNGAPAHCVLSVSNTTRAWLEVRGGLEKLYNGQNVFGDRNDFGFHLGPRRAFVARVPYLRSTVPWSVNVYAGEIPAEWRKGGYRDWLARQDTLAQVRELVADAGELAHATDGALVEHLATVLAARYAAALADWQGEPTGEAECFRFPAPLRGYTSCNTPAAAVQSAMS